MSYYDKSDKIGYDDTDKELNEELEEMLARTPPHIQRHLQHRIHDGILQRMKEDTARRCWEFIKKYETCVNSVKPYDLTDCRPHRDALNDCAHEVNREQIYQKYRMMYLRGELLKLHESRLGQKMETMKVRAPDSIRGWKPDYAPKYAEMMSDIGLNLGPEAADERKLS
ncbi:hypothetical protein, conserved [Trypanosoma brucei gambiense DAL972]|uniref:COX assembly mitochondrial protein n=1 Tax=Trypanosoma brucei gambiense (strain MHOM/CI/86/DAL972) TaxID=679716 RepID=C9ZXE7_TRYB9|nr:hypothetical protein, conserved [Trypanosoma brucei gambiense DAL972]CBH14091.1 hypothetical protein, conserved [Trypanosoma brucei gambiense DAL972]|eukprot:XP_011776362.1 hypothetical protein, conserved [Trypanosoma brucei gambiense DAL972]